jgi:hypothetical protein
MREWKLEDESGYVEHRDREKAQQHFHLISDMMNALTDALDTIEIPDTLKHEDEQEFMTKVEERIRTFLPGAEIRAVRLDEEE